MADCTVRPTSSPPLLLPHLEVRRDGREVNVRRNGVEECSDALLDDPECGEELRGGSGDE